MDHHLLVIKVMNLHCYCPLSLIVQRNGWKFSTNLQKCNEKNNSREIVHKCKCSNIWIFITLSKYTSDYNREIPLFNHEINTRSNLFKNSLNKQKYKTWIKSCTISYLKEVENIYTRRHNLVSQLSKGKQMGKGCSY